MKKIFVILFLFILLTNCSQNDEEDYSEFQLSETRLKPKMIIETNGDERYLLTSVIDLKEDSFGNIYLLDDKECNVKVFSQTGSFLRKFGSKGKGPGEFLRPEEMEFINDSILISDSRLKRFTYFDLEGNYLRSQKLKNDSPGKFEIDSDNNIYNSTTMFRFSGEYKKIPLLKIYNSKFELINKLGNYKVYDSQYKTYIMNMLSFDLNSKNQPIIAYMIQNRLDLINQKNKTIRIKRKLFYNPKEPNIVSKKDGDNWSFRASYDPISFDICLDNQYRTYRWTNHKTTQKCSKE